MCLGETKGRDGGVALQRLLNSKPSNMDLVPSLLPPCVPIKSPFPNSKASLRIAQSLSTGMPDGVGFGEGGGVGFGPGEGGTGAEPGLAYDTQSLLETTSELPRRKVLVVSAIVSKSN
jgi:hypothetical protein